MRLEVTKLLEDARIVWDVISDSLPALLDELASLLSEEK